MRAEFTASYGDGSTASTSLEYRPTLAEAKAGGRRLRRPHRTGLLVVANAAVDIQYSRDEAYLGHRRFVRTRLWKQVTDLGDLTFGLLPRNKEILAECLASRVL